MYAALFFSAATFTALYTFYGLIYRLYFSPLAKFPGPKLAAATRWYEFYYDVVLRNRFSWQIQKLHDRYGKKNSQSTLLQILNSSGLAG